MKHRLILIAVMFIVINLIFYFGFDSSDKTEKSIEFDDANPIDSEENPNSEYVITNPINP